MPFKQDSLDFGGAVSADRLVAAANHLTQLANRDEAGLSAHGWSAPRTVELQHILVQLKEVVSLSGRDLVLPELLETAQRLKAARLWGSQLSYYLENALGPNHPALEKVRPPLETWGPDETLHWLDPLLEIARKYEIELSHWGGGSMFNMRGAELRETVRQQCGVVFPGSDLSSSAQRLIQLKSLVHVTLQRLVRCGKALWIDEPLAAGRYHLQFLEPNVPLPLEFTTPGLGVTAGADSLSMLDASVVGDDFEADLRIESLAIGSVLPMGEESVHRVPPGWYHEPEVAQPKPPAPASIMAQREQTSSIEAGMSVGTEWGSHKDPQAQMPPSRKLDGGDDATGAKQVTPDAAQRGHG